MLTARRRGGEDCSTCPDCLAEAERTKSVLDSSKDLDQLLNAIKANDDTKIKELLKKGHSVQLKHFKGVVEKGNLSILKLFMEDVKKIENDSVIEILCWTATYGRDEILLFLLELYEVSESVKNKMMSNAVAADKIEIVKILLERDGDVNFEDGKCLLSASRRGYYEMVRFLLEEGGADVHCGRGDSIDLAVMSNDVRIVKLLLEKGADVDNDNGAALKTAAMEDYLEIAKVLVGAGADVNINDEICLYYAVSNGNMEMVKLFLDNGAEFIGNRKFMSAAVKGGNLEIVKLILSLAVVDIKDLGWPMTEAAQAGHLDIVKYFDGKGVDVHFLHELPLKSACSAGQLKVVEYLVMERGAKINSVVDHPLTRAVQSGNLQVVKLLVERGADIKADGSFAIVSATVLDHLDIKKYLLSKGAGEPDLDKWTLTAACKQVKPEVVDYLLKHRKYSDKEKKRALDTAIKMGCVNCVAHIVDSCRSLVDFAFEEAVKAGDFELVKVLLDDEFIDEIRNMRRIFNSRAAKGDLAMLEVIYEVCEFTDAIDLDEALLEAIRNKKSEVMEFLLGHGASIFAKMEAVMLAVATKDEKVQAVLADYLPDKDVMRAVMRVKGGFEAFHALQDRFVMPKSQEQKDAALLLAVEEGSESNSAIINLLLKAGADVHVENDLALIRAVQNSDYSCTKLLLESGADVDARDGQPLIDACLGNFVNIINLLVKQGANVRVRDDEPLMNVPMGDVNIYKLFLSKGANIQARNGAVLMDAIECGCLRRLSILLENGNSRGAGSDRALKLACDQGKWREAVLLLEHGADPGLIDGKILTNLVLRDRFKVIQRLLEVGVNPSPESDPPLLTAIDCGDTRITKLLVTHPSINLEVQNGSALTRAIARENVGIVRLLVGVGARIGAQHEEQIRGCRNRDIIRMIRRRLKVEPAVIML